jgi:dihydrofolate reductase
MRRLLLTENITADGRIEMLDDWFDPSPTGGIQDWLEGMERLGAFSDAVLLGRQTFEDFRGHWPQHTDEPAGAYLDQVQKYIVSSSMTDPQWRNSTILAGDPADEVRRLKDSEGGDITLSGSITLAHAVLGAGLVDEIRLLVFRHPGPRKGPGRRGHIDSPSRAARVACVPFRRDSAPICRHQRLTCAETTRRSGYGSRTGPVRGCRCSCHGRRRMPILVCVTPEGLARSHRAGSGV